MGAETHCDVKEQVSYLRVRNNELEAEVSRLTDENEKLRGDLGLTLSEERKLRTENAEQQARIAELEEQLEIEKAGRDDAKKDLVSAEKFIGQQGAENNSYEARISAIEKWAEGFSARNYTSPKDKFKPRGENNG